MKNDQQSFTDEVRFMIYNYFVKDGKISINDLELNTFISILERKILERNTTEDGMLQQISEYARSIDVGSMSLSSLIDSHRTLRDLNKKDHETRLKEYREMHEKGRQDGYNYATKHEYISREDLKKMTVSELAELVHDGN